jgi:hypothetical protein
MDILIIIAVVVFVIGVIFGFVGMAIYRGIEK